MSFKENDENNPDNQNYMNKNWLLVQWIGSVPQYAYDIINNSDVIFDDDNTQANLKVGSAIMVKCGKIKSHASVLQISDNTDLLYSELRKLQRIVLSENTSNLMKRKDEITPKSRKRKILDDILQTKRQEKSTQTEPVNDSSLKTLMEENQKLKAELYDSQNLISSMCTDLNNVVQGAQAKILNQSNNLFNNIENERSPRDKKKRSLVLADTNLVSENEDNENVYIGRGRTPIPKCIYNQINWLSFTAATRKLLMTIFSRGVLASHSLTGKPSPAFLGNDMPIKMRLDPGKVSDIVDIVSSKCGVSESMVRSAITTKCADENKMSKKRAVKIEKPENA